MMLNREDPVPAAIPPGRTAGRTGTGTAFTAADPHTTGLGFAGLDPLIVAAWGAAGFLVALRTFSWLPLGR